MTRMGSCSTFSNFLPCATVIRDLEGSRLKMRVLWRKINYCSSTVDLGRSLKNWDLKGRGNCGNCCSVGTALPTHSKVFVEAQLPHEDAGPFAYFMPHSVRRPYRKCRIACFWRRLWLPGTSGVSYLFRWFEMATEVSFMQ